MRGILAQLGYEKLDDIIGRTDLLKPRDISLVKTQHLDLNYILSVCTQIIACSYLKTVFEVNMVIFIYTQCDISFP